MSWACQRTLSDLQIHGLRGLAAIIASKTEVIVTANHLTQRKFALLQVTRPYSLLDVVG
jgi:hypothetical protein